MRKDLINTFMKDKSDNKEDKDIPVKGEAPLKKKRSKKIPNVVPLGNPQEVKELDEFLKDIYASMEKNKSLQNLNRPKPDVDPEIIKAILSEYLNCFALIGYDLEGKRIVIKWSPNDKSEDSLVELIRCIFLNIAQNGYGS